MSTETEPKLSLKPYGDRYIVAPLKPKEATKGGILLVEGGEMSQEQKTRGTVVRVGTGRMTDDGTFLPMFFKEGDVVTWSRYGGGEPYEEDGVKYQILRQPDIIGVIEE